MDDTPHPVNQWFSPPRLDRLIHLCDCKIPVKMLEINCLPSQTALTEGSRADCVFHNWVKVTTLRKYHHKSDHDVFACENQCDISQRIECFTASGIISGQWRLTPVVRKFFFFLAGQPSVHGTRQLHAKNLNFHTSEQWGEVFCIWGFPAPANHDAMRSEKLQQLHASCVWCWCL